jgi:hypothetical protein
MRGRRVLVVVAGVAAMLGGGGLTAQGAAGAGAVSGAARVSGSWGKAIAVPGLPAQRGRDNVLWVSMSCGAAGNCAIVGSYQLHGHSQGFVATERNGRWRKAVEEPAVGSLYSGKGASVSNVSCGAAGDCAAVGYYRDRQGHDQGFVAVERNGRWHSAIEMPGLGALNKGDADVSSVSCTSAGDCTAGGNYTVKAHVDQGFVAVEKNGVWGKPVAVPGLAAAYLLSCSAAGDCAASDGGSVAVENNGVWGKAVKVPGLAALNKGGDAEIGSVSCGAAGSCAAVGYYTDSGDNSQGWVATEKNGVWGKAVEPPGLAALNGSSGGGNAETNSVSCRSAGNCTAVGTYGDPYGTGFVATEKNGVWGKTEDVGVVGGRVAEGDAAACASPGNCAAGGFDSNDSGSVNQAWVSAEKNGRWDNGFEVPGLRALNKGGDAETETVSCPSAGRCAAGGYYTDRHGISQLFVVSQTG